MEENPYQSSESVEPAKTGKPRSDSTLRDLLQVLFYGALIAGVSILVFILLALWLLGTNDTKPQNWKLNSKFAADYKDLLEKFAKLPSKPRIFVCHPVPVPGQGNFGINEAGVREQAPIIDKVAQENQAGGKVELR